MIRSSGSVAETKIAPGVYILSKYAVPTPASLQKQADKYKRSNATPEPATPTISMGRDGFSVSARDLENQSLDQLWEILPDGKDTYLIRAFTLDYTLFFGKDRKPHYNGLNAGEQSPLILADTPHTDSYFRSWFTWKIKVQRLGGYAITSVCVDVPGFESFGEVAISLGTGGDGLFCERFIPDGQPGYQRQRWAIRRTGFYIQNQSPNHIHQVVKHPEGGNEGQDPVVLG